MFAGKPLLLYRVIQNNQDSNTPIKQETLMNNPESRQFYELSFESTVCVRVLVMFVGKFFGAIRSFI
jgi:hypothetical protein